MPRGIDQMKKIVMTVIAVVIQAYRIELDGYASFSLQIQIIKDLVDHFTALHSIGLFQNAVSQCALAMVDVGYD